MHLNDKISTCLGIKNYEGQRFGIELEYENYKRREGVVKPHNWKISKDPSLRNNGVELISTPTMRKDIKTRMAQVQKFINKSNLDPNMRS